MRLFPQNKQIIMTLFLILVLAVPAFLTALPTAQAKDTIDTYAFIVVSPNPTGVNQQVFVGMWLNVISPTGGVAGVGDRFQGFMAKITKPDGTTETNGPHMADAVSSAFFAYTPNQVGTYFFEFSFPGQNIKGVDRLGVYYDVDFKPSTSKKVALTVQQDPIEARPETPLPTTYWSRPINAINRGWDSIAGNWLMSSGKAPYTKAPNTAHIVWTKPIEFGGIVGGEHPDISVYTGSAYEGKWGPPVIIMGKLYYNTRIGSSTYQGFNCIDLRTGELIWRQNSGSITLGQLLNYDSPNQHGIIPYLWATGSTYRMYDAFTGQLICSFANASSGTTIFGPKGELLVYVLDTRNDRLIMWNSTKAGDNLFGTLDEDDPQWLTKTWQWRPPFGATLDWKLGVQYNVTIPDVLWGEDIGIQGIDSSSDTILVHCALTTSATQPQPIHGYAVYKASTGEQLWFQNRTGIWSRNAIGDVAEGVYLEYYKETLTWKCFDLLTGQQLWETEPLDNDWDMYNGPAVISNGKFYTAGYGGILYAFDLTSGARIWASSIGSSGLDAPYVNWPTGSGAGITVADGKVYVTTGEHSHTQPLYRAWKIACFNEQTGALIWNITGLMPAPAIADGYAVTLNSMDNQIYAFGKGPSAITVAASPKIAAKGADIMIEGMVTDQSPGAKDTPAIADEYMSAWMEYLYMQQPKPENAKGVQVKLTATSTNGNVIDIGTVTSDVHGFYSKKWTLPTEGEYIITAEFEGSESYWPSEAVTSVGVGSAAPAITSPTITTSPTQAIQPSSDVPLATYVAIATAIIIIAAVTAAFLLKRRAK